LKFAAPEAEGGVLTGKALEEGVTVHVGATRWAVFLVEPYQDGQTYPPIVQPSEVAAALASRRPELEARLNRRSAKD
jgi:hypothetical protein